MFIIDCRLTAVITTAALLIAVLTDTVGIGINSRCRSLQGVFKQLEAARCGSYHPYWPQKIGESEIDFIFMATKNLIYGTITQSDVQIEFAVYREREREI